MMNTKLLGCGNVGNVGSVNNIVNVGNNVNLGTLSALEISGAKKAVEASRVLEALLWRVDLVKSLRFVFEVLSEPN